MTKVRHRTRIDESWNPDYDDQPENQFGEKWQKVSGTWLNSVLEDIIKDVQIDPFEDDPKMERLNLGSLHICEDGHLIATLYGGANGGGLRGKESNWPFYLSLVRKFLGKILDYNNGKFCRDVWLIDWDNDCCDDVWTLRLGLELTDEEKVQLVQCIDTFKVLNPEKLEIPCENPYNESKTKVILEDGESWIDEGVKMAYSAVRNKIVSMLTGNGALSTIGTVLDLLSFLPGVDRKIVDDKMKELTKKLHGEIDDIDLLLTKVPLLETLFSDEKECVKNVLRFMLFAQQISLGTYPSDQYKLVNVVTVQTTFLLLVALWSAFGASCVGTGGTATAAAWIVKDLSVLCYNAVFPLVEDDLKKFEKWANEGNLDLKEKQAEIKNGNVKKAAESTRIRWKRL